MKRLVKIPINVVTLDIHNQKMLKTNEDIIQEFLTHLGQRYQQPDFKLALFDGICKRFSNQKKFFPKFLGFCSIFGPKIRTILKTLFFNGFEKFQKI